MDVVVGDGAVVDGESTVDADVGAVVVTRSRRLSVWQHRDTQRLAERQIDDAIIATKRQRNAGTCTTNVPMGLRWPVGRTNSWLSNFGHYAESRVMPTWR